MYIKHIKESIKNKYSKGCLKTQNKSFRKISKPLKQSYQEGLKAFKESLKDSYGIDKDTQEYLKTLWKNKYKSLKGFSTLKALKNL